ESVCPPANVIADRILHRKKLMGIGFVLISQRIGMHFKRDTFVATAGEKAGVVELGESLYPKLPVLLNVYKLVEQQTVIKPYMQDDNIHQGYCSHGGLVGQVAKAQCFQCGVEIGILNALALERQDSRAQNLFSEEAGHGRLLRLIQRSG